MSTHTRNSLVACALMSQAVLAQDAWETLAPLPEPVGGFIAGCLENKIVVLGGTNWRDDTKRWLDTVWSYDPIKNTWMVHEQKLPHAVAYAAFGGDGKRLYFAGGADGKKGRKEVYVMDADLKLTRIAELPEPVVYAGGALANGSLHIICGSPDPDDWLKAHKLHLTVGVSTGKIMALPPLDGLKHGIGLPALVECGKALFTFTGAWFDQPTSVHNIADAFHFDQSWQAIVPYPMAARGVAGVMLDDTHLYLGGGYGTDAQGFLTQAWVYDTQKDTYTPAKPVPLAATTCLLRCGEHVYMLGGEDLKKHRSAACYRIPAATLLAKP